MAIMTISLVLVFGVGYYYVFFMKPIPKSEVETGIDGLSSTLTPPDTSSTPEPEPEPEPDPEPETPPTDSDIIEITMAELIERAGNHIRDTNKEEYENLIGKRIRLTNATLRKKPSLLAPDKDWLLLGPNEKEHPGALTIIVVLNWPSSVVDNPIDSLEAWEILEILETIEIGDIVIVEGTFDKTYPMVGSPRILGRDPNYKFIWALMPCGVISDTTRVTKQDQS